DAEKLFFGITILPASPENKGLRGAEVGQNRPLFDFFSILLEPLCGLRVKALPTTEGTEALPELSSPAKSPAVRRTKTPTTLLAREVFKLWGS
ncbi:MAG: hypothetical protein ABSA59_18105, partial [Terriglobia bacterium]